MSLRCKIGIHDWYVYDVLYPEQIEENVRAKSEGRRRVRVVGNSCFRYYNRVCLRCKKVENSIARYELIVWYKIRNEKAKKVQADRIMGRF